ncbi:hypothetical protein DINM_020724 [Dirofilaria immitis]|nr:hypothetical protein [Dirofilaria immitis]
MDDVAACCSNEVPTLKFISTRSIALILFQTGLRSIYREAERWRKSFPYHIIITIIIIIIVIIIINEKHAKLFGDDGKSEKIESYVNEYTIYVSFTEASFGNIITLAIIVNDCADWPQMQFQLACAYAIHHLLNERNFDRIRLRAFAKNLSGHCLYDFWFALLDNKCNEWERMFSSDNLAPKQILSLAFQFAIINGYFELVTFIWNNITDPQREFIGLLQWRKVCFKAKDREVLRFYANNFVSLMHQEDNIGYREDAMHKLAFLLENTCPRLQQLQMHLFIIKLNFYAFLDYLEPEQLQLTREYIDRIYDRKNVTHHVNNYEYYYDDNKR